MGRWRRRLEGCCHGRAAPGAPRGWKRQQGASLRALGRSVALRHLGCELGASRAVRERVSTALSHHMCGTLS